MKHRNAFFSISMLLALILCTALSVSDFERESEQIRQKVLRLHVVAASNSSEDQRLKLLVRDKILEGSAELFTSSKSLSQAVKKAAGGRERLREIAENTLRQSGCGDEVRVKIQKMYFPTKSYGAVTLPAGVYSAVRVEIGEGAGENWWCVMFPPLCLPAAGESDRALERVLSESELRVVRKNPKYELRFKIVEIIENVRQRMKR